MQTIDKSTGPGGKGIESHMEDGRAAGCPKEQMVNFLKAEIILQPKQLAACAAARLCDRPDGPTAVGYGGARGGGKSHWLLAQMGADDCQRVPSLKCLLLRKVGKANLEHFEDLRRRLFSRLDHDFAAFRGILTFGNGSRIIAGHFQNEKDIDAYLGLEYDVIGVEEASQLTYRKFQDISTCCRSSKVLADGRLWRPRIYTTTNPGGVGHTWYRAKFVVPYLAARGRDDFGGTPKPTRETRVLPSGETVFVPARVGDNTFNNPEYRRVLEGLTGWQKRAWLDGDWDIAAGQFFTTFRREVHVIEDFDETRAVEWFAAMDYGYAHYTVCLLGCRDGDGNVYVVDEHAERLWLPERHAAAIKAMCERHGVTTERRTLFTDEPAAAYQIPAPTESVRRELSRFVAGTDMFSRQSDGTTVAEQYGRLGIRMRPANMDRLNGWAAVQCRFGDVEAGVHPTLFVHKRCARLIETLPALQHDPHRPEDVLKVDADEEGNGGDDAADALRYLVATKPREVRAVRLGGV